MFAKKDNNFYRVDRNDNGTIIVFRGWINFQNALADGFAHTWNASIKDLRDDGYEILEGLDYLTRGDVLKWCGKEYLVEGRLGDIVFLSYVFGDDNYKNCTSLHISELKDDGYGYALVTNTPKKKMTVAEIAEKLGHEVEVVE